MEKKPCPVHDIPRMPGEPDTDIFFGPRGAEVTNIRQQERCTCNDKDDDHQDKDDHNDSPNS